MIVTSHCMSMIGNNTKVFKLSSGLRTNAQRAAESDAYVATLWERLEWRVWQRILRIVRLAERTLKHRVLPHIGTTGPCVAVDAENRPNAVIFKASCKNVGRRVAACVSDEYHRSVVELSDRIALFWRRDWKAGRKCRSGL